MEVKEFTESFNLVKKFTTDNGLLGTIAFIIYVFTNYWKKVKYFYLKNIEKKFSKGTFLGRLYRKVMYNGLDNLESHELFSTINRIKARNLSANYGFNKFRNEICKDYINCLLDFHKKEVWNFIKGETWDGVSKDKLLLIFEDYFRNMRINGRLELAEKGIPQIFIEKMGIELENPTENIFNQFKILCSSDYNKNIIILNLVLINAKVQWESIELACYEIMQRINGDFRKQGVVYKGYKDESI